LPSPSVYPNNIATLCGLEPWQVPPLFRNLSLQLVARKSFMMEIPSRYPAAQRSSLDPPEILVYGSSPSDPYRSSSRSSSYTSRCTPTSSAEPMSIPNSRDPPPPPPLPPPRFLHLENDGGERDPGWEWENSRRESSWRRPSVDVHPGSSLYGSFTNSVNGVTENRPDLSRRTSSTPTITSISGVDSRRDTFPRFDEGYASASVTSVGSNLLVKFSCLLRLLEETRALAKGRHLYLHT
jgi:hypothetical protein